jgi:hypothetical protein
VRGERTVPASGCGSRRPPFTVQPQRPDFEPIGRRSAVLGAESGQLIDPFFQSCQKRGLITALNGFVGCERTVPQEKENPTR